MLLLSDVDSTSDTFDGVGDPGQTGGTKDVGFLVTTGDEALQLRVAEEEDAAAADGMGIMGRAAE